MTRQPIAALIAALFTNLCPSFAGAPSFTGLGNQFPAGTFHSYCSAISADGTTIVGYFQDQEGTQGFRWSAMTGAISMDDQFPAGTSSWATGVSANGTTVVGRYQAPGETRAFRWTQG